MCFRLTVYANKRKGLNSTSVSNYNKSIKKYRTPNTTETLMFVERVLAVVILSNYPFNVTINN